MKKTYINPAMEVIKIQTQQFLAQSPLLGGDYTTGKPVFAPGMDLDDELDEEDY